MRVGSCLYFVFSLAKGRSCWYFCSDNMITRFLCARSCTANIFVYTKVCALAKCNLFQPGTSKMIVPLWRNLWQLSAGKNQLHSLRFPEILQRYCKFVVLGTLGMPGYAHPKWYHQYEETFMFICRQKIISYPMLFWKYCKVMQTYFGYFGHAWLCTAKMIISTFRRI